MNANDFEESNGVADVLKRYLGNKSAIIDKNDYHDLIKLQISLAKTFAAECNLPATIGDNTFVQAVIDESLNKVTVADTDDKTVQYVSNNPIIIRKLNDIELNVIKHHPIVAIGVFISSYADAIGRVSQTTANNQRIYASMMTALAVSRFIQVDQINSGIIPTIREKIDELHSDTKEEFKEIRHQIEEDTKAIRPIVAEQQARQLDIATSLAQMSALQDAVRSKMALEEPIKTWEDKARRHTWIFGIGSFVLAGVSIWIIKEGYDLALANNKFIIDLAKESAVAATALFSVPLLAAFMVLRIFARLVTLNLALREDANQRRALADMYLRLISDPKSSMDEESRRIALSALFRAAPGQPIDEPGIHPALDIFNKT